MSIQQERNSSITSQWELITRRNREIEHENRKSYMESLIQYHKLLDHQSIKTFITGSTYEGSWDALGMNGYGKYTFPSGLIYEGQFKDSEFHGPGKLKYPNGTTVEGTWESGTLRNNCLIFFDGVLHQTENWKYCVKPDRRFSSEYSSIPPAGRSNLTADQPTRDIPDGYYDVGDGVYDPVMRTVCRYDNLDKIVRFVRSDMHNWIVTNCRKSPYTERGPKPELYEEWLKPVLKVEPPPFPPCARERREDSSILQPKKSILRVAAAKHNDKIIPSRIGQLMRIVENTTTDLQDDQ